ncbi:bifunctional 5,10-methylenetetrahydrofolate dehydrogenase/5,10-methenyltetrahydrofolate cyclohydrolase [Ferrimicrobium acidiphilum]|jgi:methylenetetrahydrofolate dehydrogenase (NADP+)/methenyltetrahydrofolate cyclohydrolase|uniref:bifunctional 5,10-methylenetetrahydrofolate dehydrogenase/5,10-methenyltetrahydrofolate cyclohydrolase n=1 Tax=Ferrimicrobium acidiphilum TaxID=121039 RepID=UPI0023F3E7E0|nr:tetrahydrofolate dehydrogenase/cyclohydrolase catalytic domain-containing protein [Ferrimicrobium acidiphilum]MCL5052561.1 bifunctional 5,10-methylenetetrahydrofolate dehydrogenase/5,10-methenyltetrahydrofolate cyclohydrolase [Gammaproteobacteria bacterium]
MSARVLDGNWASSQVKMGLRERIQALKTRGVTVGLATVLVGDDPPSARYVAMKHADCAELGIDSFDYRLGADVTMAELLATISELNDDDRVHSYLVQLPLPAHIDQEMVLSAVTPAKDVDGLHPYNLGLLTLGEPKVVACTPAGIVELLNLHGVDLPGKHVVIVGRGVTIGRPLALLLALNRPGLNAAVTVVHSRVPSLVDYTREADVIIAAAGSPGIITADMVRKDAVVVGAGTTFAGRTLLSDVDDSVAEVASWVTPRLGGVGPMTRAMLLSNAVSAAEASLAQG